MIGITCGFVAVSGDRVREYKIQIKITEYIRVVTYLCQP